MGELLCDAFEKGGDFAHDLLLFIWNFKIAEAVVLVEFRKALVNQNGIERLLGSQLLHIAFVIPQVDQGDVVMVGQKGQNRVGKAVPYHQQLWASGIGARQSDSCQRMVAAQKYGVLVG